MQQGLTQPHATLALLPLMCQAVELMSTPRFQPVALGLLYHVSMEDKNKSLFTFTDCLNRMYEMLVRVQVRVPRERHRGQRRGRGHGCMWGGGVCVVQLGSTYCICSVCTVYRFCNERNRKNVQYC